MPSAPCPECAECVPITVTDQPVGQTGTAMRWRVDAHPDRRLPEGERRVCTGSGKVI